MDLRFGSLRTRILVLATAPLVGMVVTLLVLGHRAAERTLTTSVRESLDSAGLVFAETVRARREGLLAQVRVTASDPRFFATFSVPPAERGAEFGPTLEGVAQDFLAITDADFLEIYDARGGRLARQGRPAGTATWSDHGPGRASLALALDGVLSADHFASDTVALMVVDVPVFVAGHLEAVLRMGRGFDAVFAAEVARLTGASVTLLGGEGVIAAAGEATPVAGVARPAPRAPTAPIEIRRGTVEFASDATARHLRVPLELSGLDAEGGLVAVLSRDLAQQLAPLRAAERTMILLGLVTLLTTIGASLAIAVGVTRPLRRVVDAAGRLRGGDYDGALTMSGRDEVAQLAQSFDAMRRDLRAYVTHLRDVDKLKSDFLSLAGHELKTPLTVIISFNDLVQSGALGELPPEIVETNGIIKDQLSRLDRMVQDILDLTALEANGAAALLRTPLEFGAIARNVLLAQEPARAQRALTVSAPDAATVCPVDADERLLARAVRALLDNAVRFTADGGTIRLSLESEHDRVRLAVHDTGVGIAPDELRWIAGKFYERGDIAHHRSGDLEFGSRGLGLGLALTGAIARAHDGELEVVSHPGRGSVFTLDLPRAARAGSLPPTPSSSNHDAVVEAAVPMEVA